MGTMSGLKTKYNEKSYLGAKFRIFLYIDANLQ